MTPQQKQSELQRHRALVLATLDYLQEHLGGSLVYDECDTVTEYYQQQKIQTEKYFSQRRLDRMQQKLTSHIKVLQGSLDLNFAAYIKEKTGYDIDIFDDLRKRVEAIVQQNEIRDQSELSDISTMLHLYHKQGTHSKEIEEITSLLNNYADRTKQTSGKRKGENVEIISSIEKGGIETVTISISNGPKPKHYDEQWATSPDNKHKLRVAQWSDGKQASTYVAIHFANGNSGAVYALNGIYPEVKAWWKNESTIVVETIKEYTANIKHKQVRSFDDVITIEYIEQ